MSPPGLQAPPLQLGKPSPENAHPTGARASGSGPQYAGELEEQAAVPVRVCWEIWIAFRSSGFAASTNSESKQSHLRKKKQAGFLLQQLWTQKAMPRHTYQKICFI